MAESPRLLAEPQADAFLGGAGEHLARRWSLPIPGWVRSERRYLDRALFVPDRPGFRAYLLAVNPVSFRTRLIFTGPDPLQRARFPYHKGPIRLPSNSATPASFSSTGSHLHGPSQPITSSTECIHALHRPCGTRRYPCKSAGSFR